MSNIDTLINFGLLHGQPPQGIKMGVYKKCPDCKKEFEDLKDGRCKTCRDKLLRKWY